MMYTVKSGDTLSKIARDVLGDQQLWREIAERNGIKGPDYVIQVGQKLELTDDAAIESSRGKGTIEDPRRFTSGLTITAPVPARGSASPWMTWLLWGALAAAVSYVLIPPKKTGGLRRRSRARARRYA